MTAPAWEGRFRRWAEAVGVGWEEVRYARAAAGGPTRGYHLTPPAPARAVVLAVHGAGNDALFGWAGLFKALLLRGCAVFTFDLDGHGRHNTTTLAADTLPTAVPAALDRASEHWPGLPAHAVGVSLGSAVLLHALPGLAGRLSSAVLVSAPLRIEFSLAAVLRELGPRLLGTLWRERVHYGATGLIPSVGPWKRGLYPLRLADAVPAGAFGYVQVLNRVLRDMDLPAAARHAPMPVLLVYGAADRLVPPEQAERLRSLLPAAELLLLPGESHLTTPFAPAAVDRMLRWLAPSPTARHTHP